MTLSLGDTAPDFTADTTEGPISFHDWIGDSWAVLFSHPKDFTPVCTTELGYMAKIKPEFDKRNTKIIGLSVDPVEKHDSGQGHRGDPGHRAQLPADRRQGLQGLEGLRHAGGRHVRRPANRTPADNQTVRNVFIIGPDKKIKLILVYPMTTGRNFDEVLRVHRLAAAHREAQGRHAGQLEGRGRGHRRLGLRRRGEDDLPGGMEGAAAVHPDRPPAQLTARQGEGTGRGQRGYPRVRRWEAGTWPEGACPHQLRGSAPATSSPPGCVAGGSWAARSYCGLVSSVLTLARAWQCPAVCPRLPGARTCGSWPVRPRPAAAATAMTTTIAGA